MEQTISLKHALETDVIKETGAQRKVLLSLNDEIYQQTLELVRKNNTSFNAFINNFLSLLIQDKVYIMQEDLREIVR